MIKIILHGSLKDRFPSFSVEAKTAEEAIEAWSMQTELRNTPVNEKPVIDVVGYETTEKLKEEIKDQELHLIPRMYGGGGGAKILLGAAMIGLAFLPFIGPAIATVLISTGIGLVLGGVMELFMKTPKVENDEGPESSKYLGSSTNTTKIGTLIPRGYGRMMVGGQYLSIQVNSSDMVFGQFPETPPA